MLTYCDYGLDLQAGLNAALGAVVRSITIETSITKPAQIYGAGDAVVPSGGGGFDIDVGAIFKPKVTVYLTTSDQPIEIAPYGEPTTAKWIVPAITLGIFLAGYYVGKKGRR